ncbi:MAG: UbiA family prenyltransferase [Elusimicrobiota bacterium]|nr:UbiA family prenyltransferase [Elusimicrobiota bacterium]
MSLLVNLGKIFSILAGVFTISAYACGSVGVLLSPPFLAVFLKGAASLFFILCAGYLMNDLCDVRYDRLNRPDSMFVGKRLSAGLAGWFVLALFSSGVVCAFFVNRWFTAVILPLSAGVALYNLYSKRLGLFKEAAISLVVASIYPLALALTSGGNSSSRRDSLYIFPVWFFLNIMAYEIMRDIIDSPGDKAGRGTTLPLRIGEEKARKAAVFLALAGIPVSLLPYLLGMCGNVYLGGAAAAALLLAAGTVMRNPGLSKAIFMNILLVTFSSLADLHLG